jgi:hypothetical protein
MVSAAGLRRFAAYNRASCRFVMALGLLVLSGPSARPAAAQAAQPRDTTRPSASNPASPSGATGTPATAAIIGSLAALLTSAAAVITATKGKKEAKEAKDQVQTTEKSLTAQIAANRDGLEVALRDLLGKRQESADIWRLIIAEIKSDAGCEIILNCLSEDRVRQRLAMALLFEISINLEYRARLAGLLQDQSALGRIANESAISPPPDNIQQVVDALAARLARPGGKEGEQQ